MDERDRHDDEAEQQAIDTLERLLLERGPLRVDELAEVLTEQAPGIAERLVEGRSGRSVADRVLELTRRADAFWRIPDGRLAPVLHRLRRATFTHRLTAAEQASGAVAACPDLLALALPRTFAVNGSGGAGGVELRIAGSGEDPRARDEGSLVGPPGWLADRPAGSLLAFRYDGVEVRIDTVAEGDVDPAATAAAIDALRATFAEMPAGPAPEVHRLVVDTIGHHPEAFATVVAPVAELLAAAGLAVREVWVGPAGAAWTTPAEAARGRRLDELVADADPCCRKAARRALDAWQAAMAQAAQTGDHDVAIDHAEARELADAIDHGPVAGVLADVATIGRPLVSIRRLGQWAGAVAAAAGAVTGGANYLRALGADADGDPLLAETLLLAGLDAEPDHPACLGLLAELQADRGDATRSVALLQRAGRPPRADALAEFAPFLVDRNVGRNEPCPCGSGRKFKACCAVTPARRPLAVRCRWLLAKATRHALRTDPLTVQSLKHLFDNSFGGGDSMALAGDLLLFANGGLARYLACRGPLLADDERAAAQAWLDEPMRVLHIGPVGADGLLAATDDADGTPLRIDDANAVATLRDGESVLTRALPVGDRRLLTTAVLRVPEAALPQARELVTTEVRPIGLLQFLVDLQVAQLRA